MDKSDNCTKVSRIHKLLSYCQATLAVKLCSSPNLMIGLDFQYRSDNSAIDGRDSSSCVGHCLSLSPCETAENSWFKSWTPVSQQTNCFRLLSKSAKELAATCEIGDCCISDLTYKTVQLAEKITVCPSVIQEFLFSHLYCDSFFGGLVHCTYMKLLGVTHADPHTSLPDTADCVTYPYATFMMACYKRTCDRLRARFDRQRCFNTVSYKSQCDHVTDIPSDSIFMSASDDTSYVLNVMSDYNNCTVAQDTEVYDISSILVDAKLFQNCTCLPVSACEDFLDPRFDSGLPEENTAALIDSDAVWCQACTQLGNTANMDGVRMTVLEGSCDCSSVTGRDVVVEQILSCKDYLANAAIFPACELLNSPLAKKLDKKYDNVGETESTDCFDDTYGSDDDKLSNESVNDDTESSDEVDDEVEGEASEDDATWDCATEDDDVNFFSAMKDTMPSSSKTACSSFFFRGSVSVSSDSSSSNSGSDCEQVVSLADSDDDEDWLSFHEPADLECLEDLDPFQVSGLYIPPSSTTPIRRSINCSPDVTIRCGESRETEFDSPIKIVNDKWNRAYSSSKISSACSTVKSKKVSFAKNTPALIPVLNEEEWAEDYCQARRAYWEEMARDRDRFQRRVVETATKIEWALTTEHRSKVLASTPALSG